MKQPEYVSFHSVVHVRMGGDGQVWCGAKLKKFTVRWLGSRPCKRCAKAYARFQRDFASEAAKQLDRFFMFEVGVKP